MRGLTGFERHKAWLTVVTVSQERWLSCVPPSLALTPAAKCTCEVALGPSHVFAPCALLQMLIEFYSAVVLFLDALKAYRGSRSIAPLVLSLGAGRRPGEPHSMSGFFGKEKNVLPLLGLEPRTVQPTCWPQYRLRYHGSSTLNSGVLR